MRYENPEVPDDINVSAGHPLAEFAVLAAGALVLVVIIAGAGSLSAGLLARLVPFEFEQALASPYTPSLPEELGVAGGRERWLQALAGRVVVAADLDESVSVQVHLVECDAVNAFATLGGHIVICRALLDALPHENAVAMVLAHEIAHVRRRDPLAALGRGVVLQIALAALTGNGNSRALGGILGQAGLMTVLSFSRRQELAADDDALRTLMALYGHLAGAGTLFRVLDDDGGSAPPALFSTHPHPRERLARIAASDAAGPVAGTPVAKPDFHSED